MSPQIACRAGYHQVIRAIRAATTQGNDVINMVLSKFLTTPVALPLLPFMLLPDILRGMSALRILFPGAAIADMRSPSLLYIWTAVVRFSVGLDAI